jgi:hypothetical protein
MFKGTIEWEEVITYIKSIELINGNIVFRSEGAGPVKAYEGPASIIGPDGIRFQYGGYIKIPDVWSDQNFALIVEAVPSDIKAQ